MTDKEIEALKEKADALGRQCLDAMFVKKEAIALASELYKASGKAHAAYMKALAAAGRKEQGE